MNRSHKTIKTLFNSLNIFLLEETTCKQNPESNWYRAIQHLKYFLVTEIL